jgi:DNA-binding transcriptional MerR regulator
MERFLRVSEVARELGISAEWLRNAEVKGKILKARRNMSGWRVYDEQDVIKIRELLIPSNR